jgi:integrase/recombinase XerD
MTTPTSSTALMPAAPVFSNTERLALAGFLAGYSGLTRQAYELDLRQFASWCNHDHLCLFSVRRPDIECFARHLEARGRARATVTRRLCTVAGFCRYAVEEELLDHSPAVHVRRPRLDYESHATGLDRNEIGALLVAAGLGPAAEHALISLLAINGLRVSEATGANIEALGVERGHRTLVITRKGGKIVTIPLAPRTARAIDLAIGERCEGPVFLTAEGRRRQDRQGGPPVPQTAAQRRDLRTACGRRRPPPAARPPKLTVREGNRGTALTPARPAHTRAPALRTGHSRTTTQPTTGLPGISLSADHDWLGSAVASSSAVRSAGWDTIGQCPPRMRWTVQEGSLWSAATSGGRSSSPSAMLAM